MPIFDLSCPNCDWERKDKFFHRKPPPRKMPKCEQCGARLLVDIRGAPIPLTKTFAEDRPFVDVNIRPDGKPQVITSWGQRRKLMKEFGLEDAGVKRGMPGSWA